MTTDRRRFLAAIIPWIAAATIDRRPAFADAKRSGLVYGLSKPFSFDRLRHMAKTMAQSAYVAPTSPAPKLIEKIDFDALQKIRFRPEDELWHNRPGHQPVRFFHLNRYNALPVTVHALHGRSARAIRYRPRYFAYSDKKFAARLPHNLGFSGFRVMDAPHSQTDWLAFQGASYFRSAGAQNQYGISARGIAVDTALSTKEEFPRFSNFWLSEDPRKSDTVTVYALLDGPSITGAYKFVCRLEKDGVVMDVRAELFTRADISRLGIAPLTSMFWYGRTNYWKRTDWRPAVHDSDGLALWTGKGERIWRPLNDPPSLQVNSFEDENPKGFGLMQRDRNFADYQDDGAFYNRRPSVWVEPLSTWGSGAVQLVEIPTDDEIHDNIVAYWLPKNPVQSGSHLKMDYRLYWRDHEPFPSKNVAEVVATRVGYGGIPGQPAHAHMRKFVIDFAGGPLTTMKRRFDLKPVVTTSRGKPQNMYVIQIVGTETWRAVFDLPIEGSAPIDMRCYLKLGDKTLTETWLYQYFPQVAL